jgi:hypothetical protein
MPSLNRVVEIVGGRAREARVAQDDRCKGMSIAAADDRNAHASGHLLRRAVAAVQAPDHAGI